MNLIKVLTLASLFLTSFDTVSQPKKIIFFYEIDDRITVLVDGKQVYESAVIGHLDGFEVELDLTSYILTNEEEITINLFNEKCACESENPWEINFEIRDDGMEMDYHYDKGEGDAGDTPVYTYTFAWSDL